MSLGFLISKNTDEDWLEQNSVRENHHVFIER